MVGVRSGLAIYSIFLIILIVPIESSIMYNSNFFNSTYSKLSSSNLEDKEKTDFLIGEQFQGTYTRHSKKLFNYLDSQSGTIDTLFFYDPFKDSQTNLNSFIIFLFDPTYHDRKAVRILVNLTTINNNSWSVNNSQVTIEKFWKQRAIEQYNINNLNYTIKVHGLQTQNPYEVSLQIQMKTPDFSFSAKLDYDDERISTLGYCLYITAIVMGQVACCFMLLKQIDGPNPNFSNKFSLATVALCNIEDFYLTMMHIQYIMASSSNSYLFYIIPSFAFIVLFVIFDMKLLFLVWRSHYMRQIDNPQALRKKLTTFYIKFYVALFIYLTLSYFFASQEWLILMQNLFFIPQIVHNVKAGNNPGYHPYYLFGYLGLRLFIPLYERSCPANHFQLSPIIWIVITLIILYTLQILILLLQSKVGPRFFIPKVLQPDYYNYNFKIKPNENNNDLQCAICLVNIFIDENDAINSSQLSVPMLTEKNIMKTPCNHFFHKECLTNWIDVKMQCPTCRSELPPL